MIKRRLFAALLALLAAASVVSISGPATALSAKCEQRMLVYFWYGVTGLRDTTGQPDLPRNSAAAPPLNYPTHAACDIVEEDLGQSSELLYFVHPGATLISARATDVALPAGAQMDYAFGGAYFGGVKSGKATVECNLGTPDCTGGVLDASTPLVPMNPVAAGQLDAVFPGWASLNFQSVDGLL